MTLDLLMELVGWTGAVLVLGAYILVTAGRLQGNSAQFQWMNLLGSAAFIANTAWHRAIPSMVLNIIWSLIGFVALFRLWRRARRS
jgi:hypothetical protein